MALFDYVLRGGGRQTTRTVLEGALKPIIVLGAVIAFLVYLVVHKGPKPAPRGPTEVKFFAPSATTAPPAPPAPSGK